MTARGTLLILMLLGLSAAGAPRVARAQFSQVGERKTLLELRLPDRQVAGRLLAHDQQKFWFLGRDGSLFQYPISSLQEYRELGGDYRPHSAMELKQQLSREFGSKFDVASTGTYLVVAARGEGVGYAKLFDELHRQFTVSFRVRGLPLQPLEYPLVAVVWPDQGQFVACCKREGVTPTPGLMGYYLLNSNRVVLYDSSNQRGDEALDETVIHEAIHQVAFNTGLHSRLGGDPQWLVEGLATSLEPSTTRINPSRSTLASRVNRERYVRFRQFEKSRRSPDTLQAMILNDDLFRASPLDGYAQAWALTFFLMERRPADYTRYLQHVSKRSLFQPYTAEARLRDFEAHFGTDWKKLDLDLLRFQARALDGLTE